MPYLFTTAQSWEEYVEERRQQKVANAMLAPAPSDFSQ